MSDYTEHLISMAGGDGEPLEAIERRITDCKTYKFGMRNADKLAHEDAPYLLALVREQQARIERVEAQLNEWASFKPFPDAEKSQRWYSLGKRHAADSIRAALEPTP